MKLAFVPDAVARRYLNAHSRCLITAFEDMLTALSINFSNFTRLFGIGQSTPEFMYVTYGLILFAPSV